MKYIKLLVASVILVSMTACLADKTELEMQGYIKTINVVGPDKITFEPISGTGQTKATSVDDGIALVFNWAAGDTLGIFPNKGGQVEFPITSQESSTSASFDGGGWALRNNASYAAYYPFNVWNCFQDNKTIIMDYSGQVQNGNGSFAHLSAYDFLASSKTTPQNNMVTFHMDRQGSILYIDIVVPVPATITSLTISCDEAIFVEKAALDISGNNPVVTPVETKSSLTLNFENTATTERNETVRAYMAVQPLDFSSKTVTATLATDAGTYTAPVVSRVVNKGKAAFLRFSDSFTNGTTPVNIEFADAMVKRICVERWDTDGDDELSYDEAAAVTSIPYGAFSGNKTITSFDEFQYFTGVTNLGYDSDYDEGMDYYGTFYNCTALTSIVLPPTLNTITYGCFRDCSALEEIVIPQSVTTIQQVAFLGCTNLVVHMESETPCTLQKDTYDTYPDPYVFGFLTSGRVKSILVPSSEAETAYKSAQYWPSSLIHKEGWVNQAQIIAFQDAITELICVTLWDTNEDGSLSYGEAAAVTDLTNNFQGSEITSFDELQYFTGLSTLPDNAFNGCAKLKSIAFPPSLTSMGNNALKDCNTLERITVPTVDMWINMVAAQKPFTMNADLFVGQDLVTEVVVPDGTVTLSDYLFQYLYRLEKVILPEGLKTIGAYAFKHCAGLSEINIPQSLKTIGDYAFYYCSSLSELSTSNVTSIGKNAFCGCSSLTEISVDSLTYISEGTFCECSSLTEVIIPAGVKSLGKNAFSQCTGLTKVVFPASLWLLNDEAFDGCTLLSQVTFSEPEEGTLILKSAVFRGCTSLKEIILPMALNLLKPDLGYHKTSIGAFFNTGIEKIECYDTLLETDTYYTYDGKYESYRDLSKLGLLFSKIQNAYNKPFLADQTRSSVKEIVIHKTKITYTIPKESFRDFSNVETISLPAGITSIGDYAFSGCSKLGGVPQYNTISSIGRGSFSGCSSIMSASIPGGMTSVPREAFSGCSNLEAITIPDSVTEIVDSAFFGCAKLTSITIPAQVTTIYYSAFGSCTGLQTIRVLPTTPPTVYSGAFNGSTCQITVPPGTRDAYASADYVWSEYASRLVEAID